MRPGEIYAQYAAEFYSYCLESLSSYLLELLAWGVVIYVSIIGFNIFRYLFATATDTEDTFEINHHRYGNSDDW